MRDLLASSAGYINASGGLNGQNPTNVSIADIYNVERILLSNDARSILANVKGMNEFGTSPQRDSFLALCNTDLTPDLQAICATGLSSVGGIIKAAYPSQDGLKPEEYCQISRFRFFVSSRGIKLENASSTGANVYKIPMFGVEAYTKVEQNQYSALVGFRPDWVVSNIAQNSQLYAKFGIARAITNQNWLSGLNVTQLLGA